MQRCRLTYGLAIVEMELCVERSRHGVCAVEVEEMSTPPYDTLLHSGASPAYISNRWQQGRTGAGCWLVTSLLTPGQGMPSSDM